jgi:hypothetical protein
MSTVVPVWRRDLRLTEWLLLQGKAPHWPTLRDLLEFWRSPPRPSLRGQWGLPGLDAPGWAYGALPKSARKTAKTREPSWPWDRLLLGPGVLRTVLPDSWGLRATRSPDASDPLQLPPAWSLSGDDDNALVVQRLARTLLATGTLPGADPHLDRISAIIEGIRWPAQRSITEELATAAALVWLRIPASLVERDAHIAADDISDGIEHLSHLAVHDAEKVARALFRAINAALPGGAEAFVRMAWEADGPQAELPLPTTPRPPAVGAICDGLTYLGRTRRRSFRRRRARSNGLEVVEPRLESVHPFAAADRCCDLLALLHLPTCASSSDSWHSIGRRLGEALERGERLPEETHAYLSACPVSDTFPVGHWWAWLRRDHLRVVWPHVFRRAPLGDLLGLPRLRWSGWRLQGALDPLGIQRASITVSGDGESTFAGPWAVDQHKPRPFRRPPKRSRWRRSQSVAPLHSSLNVDAATLTLKELVGALGQTPRRPLDSRRFLGELDAILARSGDACEPDLEGLKPGIPPLLRRLPREIRYRRHAIAKSDGGARWLDVPHPALAQVQRRLADVLAAYEPARAEATAFAPYRSPSLHARMHAGCRSAAVVDIRDFFGSVRPKQFAHALAFGSPRDWSTGRTWPLLDGDEDAAEALLELLFYTDSPERLPYLPQGSPASPVVANLVAHGLDATVNRAATEAFGASGWSYSRYADDLVLSASSADTGFAAKARRLLEDAVKSMGWRVASEKSRTWLHGHRGPLVLCGIVVPPEGDGPLAFPRETARRVRAAWHHALQGRASRQDHGLLAYAYAVTGRHAYRAVIPGHTGRVLGMIAHALAGEAHREDFVDGWLAALTA